MSTATSKMGLTKPAGTDPMARSVLNTNLETLDTLIPVKTCTAATRPGAPFVGQLIFETDTGRMLLWNSVKWQILTKKPACQVYLTANELFTQSGLKVPWDAESYDTDGFWAATPNPTRLTIPTGLGGVYLVSFKMRLAEAMGDFEFLEMGILKNGAAQSVVMRSIVTDNDHFHGQTIQYIDSCVAGDYFEAWIDQNTATNHNLNSGVNLCSFNITYLM